MIIIHNSKYRMTSGAIIIIIFGTGVCQLSKLTYGCIFADYYYNIGIGTVMVMVLNSLSNGYLKKKKKKCLK